MVIPRYLHIAKMRFFRQGAARDNLHFFLGSCTLFIWTIEDNNEHVTASNVLCALSDSRNNTHQVTSMKTGAEEECSQAKRSTDNPSGNHASPSRRAVVPRRWVTESLRSLLQSFRSVHWADCHRQASVNDATSASLGSQELACLMVAKVHRMFELIWRWCLLRIEFCAHPGWLVPPLT
jgi:hypothetical protein